MKVSFHVIACVFGSVLCTSARTLGSVAAKGGRLEPSSPPLSGCLMDQPQVFLMQFISFNTNQSTFIPKRLISSKKYTPVKTFSQENDTGAGGALGVSPRLTDGQLEAGTGRGSRVRGPSPSGPCEAPLQREEGKCLATSRSLPQEDRMEGHPGLQWRP